MRFVCVVIACGCVVSDFDACGCGERFLTCVGGHTHMYMGTQFRVC